MNILSLGAGVQSTTLLLMSLHGDLPLFDAAIFADTGAEPDSVYQHLKWLEEQVGDKFPVYRVTSGDIEADILASLVAGTSIQQPPFYVLNSHTQPGMPPDSGGMIWRKCTQHYKLRALRRKVRELWESTSRKQIYQFIGISWDEVSRVKESGVQYITNVYPLVETRTTREACLAWMRDRGYPDPPKSACYFCPYTSNVRWQDMKERDPSTFARAIEFDRKLRTGKLPGVTGDVYLHRSFIPLEEAVKTDADNGQERLFNPYGFENECEGMCGV